MMKNVTNTRIEEKPATRTFNIVAINETQFLTNNTRTYYWYGPDQPDPRPDPIEEKREANPEARPPPTDP
jgi:hypothetical protein